MSVTVFKLTKTVITEAYQDIHMLTEVQQATDTQNAAAHAVLQNPSLPVPKGNIVSSLWCPLCGSLQGNHGPAASSDSVGVCCRVGRDEGWGRVQRARLCTALAEVWNRVHVLVRVAHSSSDRRIYVCERPMYSLGRE